MNGCCRPAGYVLSQGAEFSGVVISVSHHRTAGRNMVHQKASSNLPGSNMHMLNYMCPSGDEERYQGTASAQKSGQPWPDSISFPYGGNSIALSRIGRC